MDRLKGKVALITGAGTGMGSVAAQIFAAEGARIMVVDINAEMGNATVDAIKSEGGQDAFIAADVSDEQQVQAMVKGALDNFGALHIVYNNAGIFPADDGGLTETSSSTWDQVLAVNLKGVWLGCKYAIPALIASGGGSIIMSLLYG